MLRSLRWTMPLALITLAACGGGGSSNTASAGGSSSSGGGSHDFSAGGANVVTVVVGPGPTAQSSNFNIPTTSIKICLPGTTTCTTISNVLVDTGSSGLRLFASALNGLALVNQPDPNTPGNFIAECLPFADGFTWGPVSEVDLTVGGETVSGMPMNILEDGVTTTPAVPSTCSSFGSSLDSIDNLGANGVLGVGILSQDCGNYCAAPTAQQTSGYIYYTCTGGGSCTPASEPIDKQVVNPVALFAADNNGVILQLPKIAEAGATTASGYLVFGIGTESNNGLGGATVVTTDDASGFTATYNGTALSESFIDSGSNALLLPDSSIPTCSDNMMFYCPASTLQLSASNEGLNGVTSMVDFDIGNFDQFADTNFALSAAAGPTISIMDVGNQYIDYGLPFFYGRTVFTAIVGATADGSMGPYNAY